MRAAAVQPRTAEPRIGAEGFRPAVQRQGLQDPIGKRAWPGRGLFEALVDVASRRVAVERMWKLRVPGSNLASSCVTMAFTATVPACGRNTTQRQ